MNTYDYMTYEEFGRKFFEAAVTEKRVADAFGTMAGEELQIGPMSQGPGGIARITAKVTIGQPRATRTLGDEITFAIRIPLAIDLLLDLRLDKQRFKVSGEIVLRATARAAEPLLLVIDVPKPRSRDISVDVASTSIRGEVLRIIAGVDGEIKRFIARHVGQQIDDPRSEAAKVIDIADQVANAWTGG
jgi:hypothetical protein